MEKENPNHYPKITVVVTVLNEADTIQSLLDGLADQTLKPASVIIVDGGSTDNTVHQLKSWQQRHQAADWLQILEVTGNRSRGRNSGIAAATTSQIAISDAGCVPDPTWLAELTAAQTQSDQVVAGYYRSAAETPFEQAVAPYALVMPDQVDPARFLPATRSMLLPKQVWQEQGGFNEQLNDNEDYAFSRKMAAAGVPIAFARQAVVSWRPRSNLASFWWMIFRFARGDAQAGLWRPKVGLIFGRYAIGVFLMCLWWLTKNPIVLYLLIMSLVGYTGWSISKNKKYVSKGWLWLPIVQITSDLAVMVGTILGIYKQVLTKKM